jgi:pilus assembly protein FimV
MGFSATQAWALSLGRISVQSALGEPLRAEIDVPNISAEEAASLKATVAAPAAFVAAGLEYNAAMSELQATLTRRADGRAYLKLSTTRPINDPFVDMILEASWSSGRIVRDFTMLFDPPSLKQAATVAPTLPQTSSVPATPVAPVPVKPPVVAPAPVEPVARLSSGSKSATPAAQKPMPPAAMPKAERAPGQQITVKPGDSASKIAINNKAGDVSLDQMLVALLRANPDAFTKGNLNRLRAGAVLDLPSADQAKSISAAEAAQTVFAQSKDFNEFRRNLAASAPKAAVEAPNRKATGSVEAKVEDKKPASTAADKLTLSKGALKSKADEEAKVAKERADADAKARAAELAKNIEDLKKLSSASGAAPAGAASQAVPALAVPASKPTASEPALPASAAANAPVAKPAASAPAKPASPPPAPAAEPGLIDQLMEDPTLPLAGGGLVALLGGFALYRRLKKKKQEPHVDSSFLESRLQPDSFFGTSGGQQVDTAQDAATSGGSSSMGFSNSQMSSPDDVDPVAEADVYLAYGRDMQAEEILKSALAASPERLAIHTKLLEIYAKRRDTASFQTGANNVFKLVGADSPEWGRICELGLSIDPENPLYQPGGASNTAFASIEQKAIEQEQATAAIDAQTPATSDLDLDLDLDFSADEVAPAVTGTPDIEIADASATVGLETAEPEISNSLDFDMSGVAELDSPSSEPSAEPEAAGPDISLSLDDINLDLPAPAAEPAAVELPSFELPEPAPAPAAEAPAESKSDDGMLEFDLGSLSLDLGPSADTAEPSAAAGDNSLETKLALAEEFVSIGDNDGARALIEEVVAEATGELRERAQRALSNLR